MKSLNTSLAHCFLFVFFFFLPHQRGILTTGPPGNFLSIILNRPRWSMHHFCSHLNINSHEHLRTQSHEHLASKEAQKCSYQLNRHVPGKTHEFSCSRTKERPVPQQCSGQDSTLPLQGDKKQKIASHSVHLAWIFQLKYHLPLRQEIDGPQAQQFLPCGQKLHKSRMMEQAGPCPVKR